MYRFHPTASGSLVQFSNEFRTAERLKSKTDFSGGLVFSETKLETNTIFQVRVEKKAGMWSSGIEIGVTTLSPNSMEKDKVPVTAGEMKNGTWIMSGSTIYYDGEPLIEHYGFDLGKLDEGETVGLMRTKKGALVFFIQGVSQGTAVPFIPPDMYCLVNVYGKCAMVSLMDVSVQEQSTNTVEHVVHDETLSTSLRCYSSTENNSENDKLRFHSNCGPLVKLSNNQRTSERRRPLDEFNNCVVLTHRPLRDDELFQVRIDSLVHKWSGSIEFGLITHSPESFNGVMDFPSTLTVVRTGTVIMSGNGVLHDGKATNSPYSNYNLDQLQEGDRIGVMRKANGDVVYFVNGESHGIATNLPPPSPVWGCCNLYGMAAKVTIVDRNEREEHNLRVTTRHPHDYTATIPEITNGDSDNDLLFHSNCGFHAAVINNGRTAHRPESMNDFNHGVVLTSRTLKSNEMFEIRLDKIVKKWAGSIEIGVTTHAPTSLEYPCTMTNVRTGTWMMTGNGIMHNGQSVIDEYGQSLDRLKVGDRVGVLRKENGDLHFFVNGLDQGTAAKTVPDSVYGVIDLYGQAAQATIISHSSSCNDNYPNDNFDENNAIRKLTGRSLSGESGGCDLKFHHLHGKNARVSNNGLTASRPNALGEFNAAIVISSRPLKDGEAFEVIIERMVDRWSGNIEAGVTTIKPENLMFPNTMTDIDHDTIMLSGSSIMSGGRTITNRYACNLDCLTVGNKVGMVRKADNTLHVLINGEDMGVAASDVPTNLYAVIDLYGQCVQVSIARVGDMSMVSSQIIDSLSLPFNDTSHRFSVCCGKNVTLKNNYLTATRIRNYNNALVFSSAVLDYDELFEIRISEINSKWAGTVMMGVTTLNVSEDSSPALLPAKISGLAADTWYVKGSAVYKNQNVIKENYCVNFNRLCVGDKVGLKICSNRSLKFYINGEECGYAAHNLPKKMHVVIDMFGSCESILIMSTVKGLTASSHDCLEANPLAESGHSILDDSSPVQPGPSTSHHIHSKGFLFAHKHSKNIELSNGNLTARRTSSYQAFVFGNRILHRGQSFEVQIDKLSPKWTASIIVGVIEGNLEKLTLPFNALGFKKSCWLVIGDYVYHNGNKTSDRVDINLDEVKVGQYLKLSIDSHSNLHLSSGETHCLVAKNVGSRCRALVVLYGETEQVTIVSGDHMKEKALQNKEDKKAEKESATDGPSIQFDCNPSKICEYLTACNKFKTSMCLPDAYFVMSEPVLCYCESCFKIRGENVVSKQGDPSADFKTPAEWARFPVNINLDFCSSSNNQSTSGVMTTSTSSLSNVLTTWHVAYHGLEIAHVRDVMDFGQLLSVESESMTDSVKDEKTDADELIFSPAIEYAASPMFSPTMPFLDSKTKRKLSARVAFQVLVQPGSYKVGPSMNNAIKSVTGLSSDLIHWSTKEQGSTHVSALLVKLDGYYETR